MQPSSALAYYNLAVGLHRLGRFSEAILHYKEALAIDPDQFSEWSGDVLGRFALGDPSISYGDLYEAVSVSWVFACERVEEVLSPRNSWVVDLFLN